jgi:hypothetical protein
VGSLHVALHIFKYLLVSQISLTEAFLTTGRVDSSVYTGLSATHEYVSYWWYPFTMLTECTCTLFYCLPTGNNDHRRGLGTTSAATHPRTGHRISQPSRTFSSSPASRVWAKGRSLEKAELTAPTTDEEVVDFFRDTLPPLHFPKEVALRMITHATWKYGTRGHNHRLSFIGMQSRLSRSSPHTTLLV